MGLILGFIFILTYALALVVAAFIGIKRDEKPKSSFIYSILGFGFVTLIVLFYAFFIPIPDFYTWNGSIIRGIVVIISPLALAILAFSLSGNISSNKFKILNSVGMGALYATISMPWVTFYIGKYYDEIANYWSFRTVCQNAEIRYLVDVPPAKSVLIMPDLFVETNRGWQSRRYNIATLLLNNSVLEFVERTPIKGSVFLGVSKYEKITVNGERIVNPPSGADKHTEFIHRGINKSSAEYMVTPKIFELPEMNEKGIEGTRIEIRRKSDDELVAFAQYYWDDKTSKNCPKYTRDNLFARKFIQTALDIIHPESRFTGYKDR